MRKKQKWLWLFLFAYLFLLAWGILLKFSLPPYYFEMRYRAINWIPYNDLTRTWDGRPDVIEILLNILAFVPVGGLIQHLSQHKKVRYSALVCLLISLLFELVQFSLAIGITDITDIIHNSLGGLIGALMVKIMEDSHARKHS